MKKIIASSVISLTLILGACNNSSTKPTNSSSQVFNLDTTKLKSGETFYQCEMHTEVLSDKAGNCPKCDMELSEMKKKWKIF